MALNYLPFQRREIVVVPAKKAVRVQTGGFAVSNLARMATGGTKRAIIQDLIIYSDDAQYHEMGEQLRIRIGVDGRNYMTEDLYDYRVFADISYPLKAIWDWSCGKKTPYRLYPGQRMKVLMERSIFWSAQRTTIPISVQFNCLKVAKGSPIGIKEGEPMMLYGTQTLPVTAQIGDLHEIDSPHLFCPNDAPVDIYSVTIAEKVLNHAHNQLVYILDGNERPFWDSTTYNDMINILASPISFGYGGVRLDPDETIRLEIENADPAATGNVNIVVTYRGVLEVDDGK